MNNPAMKTLPQTFLWAILHAACCLVLVMGLSQPGSLLASTAAARQVSLSGQQGQDQHSVMSNDTNSSTPLRHTDISESATTPTAPFLPQVEVAGTSPSLVRKGEVIPLRPEMLAFKPLSLTVPKVSKTTLPNGMRLFVYESKDLPDVYYSVLIRAGKQLDPADKVGLAEITAKALRAGGTETLSGDEFDRQLEQIGSELEVSVEREYVRVQMFALSEQRDKALALLSDLLLHPAFDEKKLAQQKGLQLEEIRRENDEPAELSRREFRKLIYGANSPMARTPRPQDIAAINRTDVVKFYDDYYRPSSVWFGVSGDVVKENATEMVDKAFARWTKPAASLPPLPTVDESKDTSSGVAFIQKQTAQSQIRVGHLGVARHIPEEYAVVVLNGVYGVGGFSSRLMQEVRTRRGYMYGIGGGIFSDIPQGLFVAAGASKAKTTAAAISSILEVTRDLLKGQISDQEIELAKRDAVYSFFTQFDVPREIVYYYMYYDLLGYPADYLQTYVQRVEDVTKQQVVDAARKFIHPDRLKILVVGDQPELDEPLSKFGPVHQVTLEDYDQSEDNAKGAE